MRLLAPAEPSGTFDPPAFDLAARPTRPGGVHVELLSDVSPELAARVRAAAATEGLPAEAWSAIVIESERLLRTLTVDRDRLVADLDLAARNQAAVIPGGARRLADYAAALREGPALPIDRTPRIESAAGRLLVLAPYNSTSSWRLAAIEGGLTMDCWVSSMLARPAVGRALWEAASAERGESLAEWILAQTARRRSAT
jgi:hypothetical protein